MNKLNKYWALIILPLLLVSCQMNKSETDLTITLSNFSNSRTVMPSDWVDATYFRIDLVSDITDAVVSTQYTTIAQTSITFNKIPFSTYTVNAYGYKDNTPDSEILGFGSTSISLEKDKTSSVSITVEKTDSDTLLNQKLTGYVSINTSWDPKVTITSIRLVDTEGNILATQAVDSSASTVEFKQKISTGNYDCHLEYYVEDQLVHKSITETYNVYSGQIATSTQNNGITEEDSYIDLNFPTAINVTNLKLETPTTLKSLTLSFTVPELTNNFKEVSVELSNNNGSSKVTIPFAQMANNVGTTFTKTLTGLESNSHYTAKVRLINNNGIASIYKTIEGDTAVEATSVNITSDYNDLSQIKLGSSIQFTATLVPENATNLGGTWSSSDTSVIEIDENGKALACKKGNATISFKSNNNNISKSLPLSVLAGAPVLSLTLDNVTANLSWFEIADALSYNIYRKNGSATYEKLGNVTSLSYSDSLAGQVTGTNFTYRVTAVFANEVESLHSNEVETGVIVENPGITIVIPDNPKVEKIEVYGFVQGAIYDKKDTITFTAVENPNISEYIWFLNSNKLTNTTNTLSIDTSNTELDWSTVEGYQDIMLKVKIDGRYYSASSYFFYQDSQDIQVSVSFAKDNIRISPSDEPLQLEVNKTPANATVSFSSSDSSIVTVDQTGTIKGLKNGSATISVHNANNVTQDTINIEVAVPVTSLSLTSEDTILFTQGLDNNNSQTLTTVFNTDAKYQDVTWTSSDSNIISVENGVATAKSSGSATITATSVDNPTISGSITLTSYTLTMYQGETKLTEGQTFSMPGSAGNGNNYAFNLSLTPQLSEEQLTTMGYNVIWFFDDNESWKDHGTAWGTWFKITDDTGFTSNIQIAANTTKAWYHARIKLGDKSIAETKIYLTR